MTAMASIGLRFSALGASEKPPLADNEAEAIFEAALTLDIRRIDTSPLFDGRHGRFGAVFSDRQNNLKNVQTELLIAFGENWKKPVYHCIFRNQAKPLTVSTRKRCKKIARMPKKHPILGA